MKIIGMALKFALEKILKKDENIAGFLVEPIQGEAGVIIPYEGYLTDVRSLCSKYNVLFIADEIWSGLGRSGKKFSFNYSKISPDLIVLGKGLSSSTPLSYVLRFTIFSLMIDRKFTFTPSFLNNFVF